MEKQQAVSESEAPRRFNTAPISAFAIAAVLLALQRACSVSESAQQNVAGVR